MDATQSDTLFHFVKPPHTLNELLRPHTFDDVFGQDSVVTFLKKILPNFPSCVLYGPPGTGKTTLARILLNTVSLPVISISATNRKSADLLETLHKYKKQNQQVAVFVDEIHRFTRSQQDIFLPFIEDETLLFISATTESPAYHLINPLLSRIKLLTLQPLTFDALLQIFYKAESVLHVQFFVNENVRNTFIDYSRGDARTLLNNLDILRAESLPIEDTKQIDYILKTKPIRYDSIEDHYQIISALHKSLRDSDQDAALYWLGCMMEGGDSPLYILRRLLRASYEDIGLADPSAPHRVLDAIKTYEFMGSPEGDIALYEVVIYLCLAPKSDSVYGTEKRTKKLITEKGIQQPPLFIKQGSNKVLRKMGYGKGYVNPHHADESYKPQDNWPESTPRILLYKPTEHGFETTLKKRIQYLQNQRNFRK